MVDNTAITGIIVHKKENKMVKKAIIIGVLTWCVWVITTTAQAGELSKQHKNKQEIFDGITVGDAVTTIIGAGCTAVKEVNPILQGASPDGVIGFFIVRNVLHRKITETISVEWRDAWLNTTIGAQALVVASNVAVLAKHC